MLYFEPNFFDHLLIFLLGVIFPLRALSNGPDVFAGIQLDTRMKKMVYWSNSLSIWGFTFVVLLVWWTSGRSFAQLGFAPPPPVEGQPLLIIGVFAILYMIDFFAELKNPENLSPENKTQIGFIPVTMHEYLHFSFMAFSAAVTEEILFRSYFMNYLISVAGTDTMGIAVAIAIPAAVFGLVHLYQGWKTVIKIVAMAIFFGVIYLHLKNLWVLIVIHFVVDMVGGSIGLLLAAKKQDHR